MYLVLQVQIGNIANQKRTPMIREVPNYLFYISNIK